MFLKIIKIYTFLTFISLLQIFSNYIFLFNYINILYITRKKIKIAFSNIKRKFKDLYH